jgi:hypothetical protein
VFLIVLTASSGWWSGAAWGQNATSLQFDFLPVGARSLAMGGAFIGLADDATAAYTNPAGLASLTVGGPEVAVELRNWRYSTVYPKGGRFSGTPTGIGLDTVSGPVLAKTTAETSGLSFLSVGYVFPHGLVTSLYRQQVMNFASGGVVDGYFGGKSPQECISNRNLCPAVCAVSPELCPVKRTDLMRWRNDVTIVALGLAAAHELKLPGNTGALSLGVAVPRYTIDYRARVERYGYTQYPTAEGDRRDGGLFGPPDLIGGNIDLIESGTGADSRTGVNVGLLWRFGHENHWSLGSVYRKGARFRVDIEQLAGPAHQPEPLGTVLLRRRGNLRLPDSAGAGVAYSAHQGRTKVTFDYAVARFSQRFDDVVQRNDPNRPDFRIPDSRELHLGLEQVFLDVDSLFVGTLRLGAWREGAHELEYRGSNPTLRQQLPPGKDQMHYSGGLGLVIKEDFQIDVAADVSDRVSVISVSLVRFF